MKKKPDDWKIWTRYCPLPIVLVVVILMLPIFIGFQFIISLIDGLRNWVDNIDEVINVMKSDDTILGK